MAFTENLTLYVLPHCPYCHKVENFMKEKNIQNVHLKNIEEPAHEKELLAVGGKRQVPCLVHNNNALYESDDIIIWLEENVVQK